MLTKALQFVILMIGSAGVLVAAETHLQIGDRGKLPPPKDGGVRLDIGSIPPSSGRHYAAIRVEDNNHWIWTVYPGWGIFWAGDGSSTLGEGKLPEHHTGTDPSNPNEVVFVGRNSAKAAIDLDTGDGFFNRVKAKELHLTAEWADHVFADDYPLMPLRDVAAFIEVNRHLPGVPTAESIAANGLNVGESQATLLAKLEELTLYLLAQEKRIAELEEALWDKQ